MTTTARAEISKIVARVRRVWGNDAVERGGGSSGWLYRINAPNGTRIQLHGTPSDRNWYKQVWQDLNAAGFEEDEENFLAEEEERNASTVPTSRQYASASCAERTHDA